ncbi:hypothetical protein U1Q18_003070 [Sarracenia purpurea var. burkii]
MAMTTKKNTCLFVLFPVIAILVVGNVESAVSSPIFGSPPPPISPCTAQSINATVQCNGVSKPATGEPCCVSLNNLYENNCWCFLTLVANVVLPISTWNDFATDCGITASFNGCGGESFFFSSINSAPFSFFEIFFGKKKGISKSTIKNCSIGFEEYPKERLDRVLS